MVGEWLSGVLKAIGTFVSLPLRTQESDSIEGEWGPKKQSDTMNYPWVVETWVVRRQGDPLQRLSHNIAGKGVGESRDIPKCLKLIFFTPYWVEPHSYLIQIF